MTRPVTLLTAQWTDLPFAEVAQKAAKWGYDGLEVASSDDHFDVHQGANRHQLLSRKAGLFGQA